jgi:hypothetical protein
VSIHSDLLQPVYDSGTDPYRPLERWKLEDVVSAEMHPQDNPNLVQNPTPQPEPVVKESLTVAVEPDEEDSYYRVPHPGDVGKKVWVRDQEDPTADDGVWFERTLVAVLPDAQPGNDSHRCFVCSSNGKDAHSVCHTWRFARILKDLSVKPPQPEPTVKESLTVAVEPEPVIKDSLTTEEIADTYERVQQIVVVTDDSGDEALYLDGVLKAWDSTICACDIAAIAGDAIVTVSHRNVGKLFLDWPKKLSDVFPSNNPEIPDSSDSSETPNSSIDIGELERCEANEKITIGYTVPNAYDTDAEPITEPIQRKRVLYIAGPMRGIAWFNYPLFDRVAKELREAGNEVISPADEDRAVGFDPFANPSHANPDACTFPKTMDFAKTVRRCLDAVLRCDEIVLLPGWENSNGAVAELTLAMWLGKRVRDVRIDDQDRITYLGQWVGLTGLAMQLSDHHIPEVEVPYPTGLAEQDDEDDEDILAEASRITRGSRQAQYGPPDQDFRRTAGMWSALFLSKLKDGVTFEPRDVALAMILLKTSRETHQRKRDNWVDIAGYASCGSRCN